MDVVHNLINVKRFVKYTLAEKLELKTKGRPLPHIEIVVGGSSRGKTYKRQFNCDVYSRNEWICGCNKKNALFCFACILFGGDRAWTELGVTDLVHLSEKLKKHENSRTHLYNQMQLALLGAVNIQAQLDSAYWKNIQKHNEDVKRNRYVLSKIINCIKFCGAFELALLGHDDADTSKNPGIFRGLINFSAELDKTLEDHLKTGSTFKGSSKEIQNDLLDCILEVCHEEIISEIDDAPFLAIMADETTDISGKSELVTVFRYTKNGDPVERFWDFLHFTKHDAESLTETLLSVMDPIVERSPNKLIAQSYDGINVMSGPHGVQAKIKEKYPFAHFMHCYAHQLNLVMSKTASENSQVRLFFSNLQDIPEFFNSPQRIAVLAAIVERQISDGATTRWNFHIRTVNVVFEHRESLIECMEELQEGFQHTVCNQASAIRRMLEDPIFIFWLTFFHHVMPHVDTLIHQLQTRNLDPTEEENVTSNFEQNITGVRNEIDKIIEEASEFYTEPPKNKRKRPENNITDNRVAAVEVCDAIINSVRDRFAFKEHLVAGSLFFPEKFMSYHGIFPEQQLNSTCSVYPALDKDRLKTELSVIYSRADCRGLSGALPLLKFLVQNNLEEVMRETKKLLEIIVTIPMVTAEPERCFSTLKRIKTFLRNSVGQSRLTALAMISVEKEFIANMVDFDEKVIDKFSTKKERRIDLIYK